jgi:hypothetical protein
VLNHFASERTSINGEGGDGSPTHKEAAEGSDVLSRSRSVADVSTLGEQTSVVNDELDILSAARREVGAEVLTLGGEAEVKKRRR